MRLTFLGTGPSLPVPRLGCRCVSCRDARGRGSKTKRSRSSVVVTVNERRLLIDASPDVLEQFERVGIPTVDAVILTHAHADAVGGLNDLDHILRAKKHPATVLMEPGTLSHIHDLYEKPSRWVTMKKITAGSFFKFSGITIRPFRVLHSMTGRFPTLGYRIGSELVYASDVRHVPTEGREFMGGIRHLVLDGCMWFDRQIKSHFTVDRAIMLANRLRVKNLYLTQIGHTYPPYHEAVRGIREFCKKQNVTVRVTLAFDGLRVLVT